ncbi:putative RNA-directed DNA polymerase from transposon BS [Folsomia candida]|uniref:Putative RNA-directed DNA polymerase from transposon BS n=1 Tax=Folsomia candida TaxID=158441 RepID=A0A226DHE0_FOLCA|nr:putative RNA-directed DNA polymerase from transposon BS [Folsomia candida]
MSLNCSSCHEKFKPRQFRISCGICLNSHHRICLPSKIPQKDWTLFKKNWKCISCSSHTSSIPQHVLQNLPFFIDPRVEEESTTINFPDDANIGEKSSSFYNIDIDVQLVLDIVLSNIDKAEIPEFYNGLRIGHLNCNSLADSNVPDSFISISDYNMIRSDRLSRGGGGSIIYLHSAIKYLPLSYEVNFPKEVEVNCVQIFPKFRKPLIIVLIYRPPLDSLKSQFIRSLECLLFQIEKDKVDYMLLGDWNMDLMKYDNHTVSLNSVTRSFALKQLIDVPTRVTSSSSTLIDHIYTNCPQKFIQSGAFDLTTSDHRFTFTILATKKVKVPPRIVTYRPKKNVDWENVGTRINNLDWSELDSKYSVDVNLNYFHTSILNILDEECPSKKKRIKGDSAAWMNDDILNLIDKRVGLKATCAKDPSPENFKIYRKFKNYVSNQVQKAKRNFFITNFDNTCDSNHIWRTYDKLTGKNVKFSLDIPVLVEGDNIITDNVEKVNLLSNSFIINDNSSLEERENLLQNLKIMSNDETVPASQAVIDDELVYMQSSISKCLHKMKWKNSPNDVIPVLALKNLAPHILLPLSLLFIQFFNACEFPSYFKKAIVIPLYKGKGKISDPENYRPISMLPNLSKLFEYCVNNKLMNHVESNNLLEDNQHGFRSGRSCATVLTLFTSYFVSDPYAENRGIGQGTVNGPALFICFFDKVKNVLYDCWHSLFADDLSLYISDTDANYGIKRMQVILERLDAWCTSVDTPVFVSRVTPHPLMLLRIPNTDRPAPYTRKDPRGVGQSAIFCLELLNLVHLTGHIITQQTYATPTPQRSARTSNQSHTSNNLLKFVKKFV